MKRDPSVLFTSASASSPGCLRQAGWVALFFLLESFLFRLSIFLTLVAVASTALSLVESVTMSGSSRILALLHDAATARPALY